MAKITDLPSAAAIAGTEVVPIVQGGNTVRTTVAAIPGKVTAVNGRVGAVTGLAEASEVQRYLTGVDYTGVTDATAAINAACVSGAKVVTNFGTLLVSGGGIIVPDGCEIDFSRTHFTTATGPAITLDGHRRRKAYIGRVTRTTGTWNTGADTTSIGVKIRNCEHGDYNILEVANFELGIDCVGEAGATDAGTTLCTIRIGKINDNKRGMAFHGRTTGAGIGYANQNTIIGGAIRISTWPGIAGSKYIDLTDQGTAGSGGNGNLFLGVDLEGTAPAEAVTIDSVHNMFIGCRWESGAGVTCSATSADNVFFGGVGLDLMGITDASGKNIKMSSVNGTMKGRALTLLGAMVAGSTVRANSGLASEVSIGAMGPGAEAGMALGTALDTYMYRYGAGYMGLPNIRVAGRILTTDTAAATTLGSVVRRLPIYDGTNTLLGYIPIYGTIT